MRRSLPLHLALTFGILAAAACGEDRLPTQPDTAGDPAPAATSLALASNSWTPRAPFVGAFSIGFGVGVAPNASGQSIVYTFGGVSDDEGGSGAAIQAYNVATNTWTAKNSYDHRVYVYDLNGVVKIGSRLYFSGGRQHDGTGDVPSSPATWAYDYTNDRLIRKADMPKATSQGVTGVIDGKMYVLPGECDGSGWPYPGYCDHPAIRQLFRYDPATNTWVARKSAPHYHKNAAGGVLGGKFYVAGGLDDRGLGTAALDAYDPTTNTWRTLAPLPIPGPARGTVLGSKLFVIVGFGSERRAYAYDPATNTWKARAAPTWDHAAIARVTLDGVAHLLAVGGGHLGPYPPGDIIPNDSELYTR
jgi:N-acetylneuraminic acid mutarotase